MRSSFYCLFILAASILATSCSPVYVPNVRNVPLFQKAGEVEAKAFYNPLIGRGGKGVDLQGAVSVTNFLALIGSYSNTHNLYNDKTIDANPYFRHTCYEVGGGYYKVFAKRHELEVFAGYGEGKGTTYLEYDDLVKNAVSPKVINYYRYFLQPTYGLILKPVSIGISLRVSQLNFTNYTADNVLYSLNRRVYFFEPAATFQTNFSDMASPLLSHLIFTAQITGNLRLTNSDKTTYDAFEDQVKYVHIGASIGVGLRFGGKSKEKASGN